MDDNYIIPTENPNSDCENLKGGNPVATRDCENPARWKSSGNPRWLIVTMRILKNQTNYTGFIDISQNPFDGIPKNHTIYLSFIDILKSGMHPACQKHTNDCGFIDLSENDADRVLQTY